MTVENEMAASSDDYYESPEWEAAKRSLAEAVEQEGWFDQHFLTRVLARLDGAGYRIEPKAKQ